MLERSASTTPDNGIQLPSKTGAKRGHVESHFWKLSTPDGTRALWLKHTILARTDGSKPVSEVWAVYFRRGYPPVGGKVTTPFAETTHAKQPFSIETRDAYFSEKNLRGRVPIQGGAIEWSLRTTQLANAYRPIPGFLYDLPLRTKTLTPQPAARFDGTFTVNGETISVAGSTGAQGHNWGRAHSQAWTWMHADAFDATKSERPIDIHWFEALFVKLGSSPRWIGLGAIAVDDALHRFDGLGSMPRNVVEVTLYRARGRLVGRTAALEFEVESDGHEMAGLRYEDPAGTHADCLNSKLALGRFLLTQKETAAAPSRAIEFRTRACALEIGLRDTKHHVQMLA